eukprot:2250871-Pyramimonas_sp.AAC.1
MCIRDRPTLQQPVCSTWPPGPPVLVYPPDLPVWFCHVVSAPSPPPGILTRVPSSSLPLVASVHPSSLPPSLGAARHTHS